MSSLLTQPPLPDTERMWNAVLSRDSSFDGLFVYGVRSTGIFCRPTCPSRRPRQSQALFFAAPEEARIAGFRPCRRCLPDRVEEDADLARRACDFIDDRLEDDQASPSVAEISGAVGVTPSRLQRIFRKAVGLTPLRYARAQRLKRFKASVREGEKVSEAIYEAGYGSSSRLYESAARELGMTPATYRKGGAGAVIRYVFTDSALGGLLVAGTATGICAVKLGDDPAELQAELQDEFPAAELLPIFLDDPATESAALLSWVEAIQQYLDGGPLDTNLPLDVLATVFQWRVWRQLQAIPAGQTRTYQQLAEELRQPTASRAVGRACATNPVAPVVPCHRAVRKDGGLAGYRWGLHRKEALLEMERRRSD